MGTVYLMIGLPGSGKTYHIQHNPMLHNLPVICPDDVRKVCFDTDFDPNLEVYVWQTVMFMVDLLVQTNDDFVIDATSVSAKRRAAFIEQVDEQMDIVAIWLDTPYSICTARRKEFPVEVMERMRDNFERPEMSEGFEDILRIPTESTEPGESSEGG